ncbi:MAG: Ppx/GppA phosphatase family protein [Methyloligellaceae bacterium]
MKRPSDIQRAAKQDLDKKSGRNGRPTYTNSGNGDWASGSHDGRHKSKSTARDGKSDISGDRSAAPSTELDTGQDTRTGKGSEVEPKSPAKFIEDGSTLKSSSNRQVYGALDLGTNNCRLLVAKATRRGFLVVDAFSRIIRLGEGMSQTGILSEEAMSRTIEALKMCSWKMHRRGVSRSRLIATEACRSARNGPDFIERVRGETGLELEIITQETEARLAVSGCASLIDKKCEWSLVFDIGGGSSELIWLDLSRRQQNWSRSLSDRLDIQNCVVAWTSIPVGVVTLAEKFGGTNVDDNCYEAMVQDVMEPLQVFESRHNIAGKLNQGNAHFLGTSGTVTTLAGVHLKLPFYDRRRVDGTWLSDGDIRDVSRQLLSLDYERRVKQPCIGEERADLVLAGCAILEALIRTCPCDRLRVADRGLREGILTTLIAEDRLPGNGAQASASEH